MSTTRQTTVWCDHKDPSGVACLKWHQEDGSASEARRKVATWGWTRVGDQDFCKEHSPERPSETRRRSDGTFKKARSELGSADRR